MKGRRQHSTYSTSSALYVVRLLLITCLFVYAGYLAVLFLMQPRSFAPDQMFLILLLFVLGIQKGRRIRLFLVDWLPFILFIIFYNMMRGIPPRLYSRVHVSEPYQAELTVFGWMADGDIPAFALQSWRADHAGEFLMVASDIVLGFAYMLFFITPIVLMAILWWKVKDRRLFWRFSCLLNLHNFMALATFVLYPTAPPWYFQMYGAIQPTDTAYGQVAAGGLVHLDEMLHMGLFATVWDTFSANHFAAVPSLHAAWPVVVAMFTLLAFGRKAWPIIFYPGLVIIGGAYFNHHYLIDYLVSWAYLLVAFIVVERAVMPWLDRVMDYNLLRANGILSGGLSSNPRRRGPAESDEVESSGNYLLRTMFLAKLLRTIRSTSDEVKTELVGKKKQIKYFAIFIAICLPLVIISYNLLGGFGKAGMRFTQGEFLQQHGRQEDAIAKFDEAINLDPRHVDAYNNRGLAYFNLRQYQRAIQDYDEAIRLNPQFAEAYINRGGAYFNLRQYQRAIQDYNEAINLDPRHVDAYNNRGLAYFRLGRNEQAIQDYDEAIRLNPQNTYFYLDRGGAYFNLGQYQRAIQNYDEAIRLNPQLAEAYINRGGAYFSLGQNEQAIKEFGDGIRLEPQSTKAYVARGNAYFKLGQYQPAIQDYDAGIRLDPQRTQAYLGRGNVYFNLGQYQRAIQNYDIAISLNLQSANAKVDQDKACQLENKYC